VILITKNTTNNIILTLAEKTTLTNVVYLFEVINDSSEVVKCFIAEDISPNKYRYNEFDLIENATEDLLNGTFELELSGFYKYNIYEQTSTTNLDPTLATNLIETGKLNVTSTITELEQYDGNQTQTVVYING
jgi:hypothetical protein